MFETDPTLASAPETARARPSPARIGFLFTLHFFHTHLRPESFPLDPVMFVGKMPLARFQEERPDEYERLVRQNKLEEFLALRRRAARCCSPGSSASPHRPPAWS